MRILLLGPPGSGNGAQARRLASEYHWVSICFGELLCIPDYDPQMPDISAKQYQEAAQTVPDSVVLERLSQRLTLADAQAGFVLDGFPRTIAQAESLALLLQRLEKPVDLVIFIEVAAEWLMQRLSGSRVCLSCGRSYDTFSTSTKTEGRCDGCGGDLSLFNQDKEASMRNGIGVYQAQYQALSEYYRAQGVVRVVQGVGEIEYIYAAIKKTAGSLLAQSNVTQESVPAEISSVNPADPAQFAMATPAKARRRNKKPQQRTSGIRQKLKEKRATKKVKATTAQAKRIASKKSAASKIRSSSARRKVGKKSGAKKHRPRS